MALLELVQRAECEEAAAAELLRLLEQDPAAVRELAAQAAGHEVALRYLLFLARRQPDLLEFLEGLEMSYPFALGLLQQMNPAGMQTLEEHARGCSATAVFMQAVAYENGCHVPQDWAEAASRYHTALELGCEQALPYLGRAAYEAGLSTAGDAELAAGWFRIAAGGSSVRPGCVLCRRSGGEAGSEAGGVLVPQLCRAGLCRCSI